MKVSVVTPNYNGLKFLNSYFETLLIQSRFIEEIIIIDNASTDGSVEFIEEFIRSPNYPIDIILIRNDENLGFAPADNQGIEIAKSEYIYSINNDVELEWNALEEIIKAMDESIALGENPFSFQSNANSEFYVINNEKELQNIYKGEKTLPQLDFENNTLIIGQLLMPRESFHLEAIYIRVYGDGNVLTIQTWEPPYQYSALYHMYFWGVFPKIEKEIDNKILWLNTKMQN